MWRVVAEDGGGERYAKKIATKKYQTDHVQKVLNLKFP